ncbi:tRNA uridine-5-carboxymethylaminomethyl(34) synthesis GTPase MnmE [Sphingomonas rosea]|uniref:tRNA uridine-5-carboxymethylaminomethyl(34) synthesis GTPase MnmE n=1 Tax=Sphingomonas rosea TaxID=335605 RepID=UPI0031DA18A1
MTDTIFALSSGALPAAVAIVRCSGPLAEEALERLAGPLPPPRELALRTLRAGDGTTIDRALVVRFAAPATVTGEPLVEFHCHGGRAVVARLLAELASMEGLRHAEPGEFTRRALGNGRLDLTQAEGLGELLGAETEWQRRAAVATAGGALRHQVEAWRTRLVMLSAQAEAAIDYVDEDETEPSMGLLAAAADDLRAEWERWLASPRAELLADGLRVVLAGPPNSGKSSLFNALSGSDKAIVTPIAGTTRDVIETRLDLGGIPITLVDTAGLRDSEDEVERIGVSRARAAQEEADLLLWLGDPRAAPTGRSTILVHARADERSDPAPLASIATSVIGGEGLDTLTSAIAERAKNILPPPDRTALNRRQATSLEIACDALTDVTANDIVITADALRRALLALDHLSGRSSTEDVLDALFGRFCLGK